MATLYHHPFCPHSRFVRLALAEMGLQACLAEERPWDRRNEYLVMNPAGTTPMLVEGPLVLPGAAVITEFLDETYGPELGGRRLMPGSPTRRAEVRRLLDWFLNKFQVEVSDYLVTEKIFKRFMPPHCGGGVPDMGAVRAARVNVRYHLQYIGHLTARSAYLAGDDLTYADLAAAAQLSAADYLGDVPWDEDERARGWYARVKARPSFRALLQDKAPGLAASDHYASLAF